MMIYYSHFLAAKEQVPEGDVLNVIPGATSKISYRIWMNVTGYDLYAGLNETIFNTEGDKQSLLQVIYNSCTDSDQPELMCKEAQVTVIGKPSMKGSSISFYLYGMFDESTHIWGVQRKLATIVVVLIASGSVTGSGNGSVTGSESGNYNDGKYYKSLLTCVP